MILQQQNSAGLRLQPISTPQGCLRLVLAGAGASAIGIRPGSDTPHHCKEKKKAQAQARKKTKEGETGDISQLTPAMYNEQRKGERELG